MRPFFPSISRESGSGTVRDGADQYDGNSETSPAHDRFSDKETTPLSPDIYTALLRCLAVAPRLSGYTYYRSTDSPTDPDTPVLSSNAQVKNAITHGGRRFSNASHSAGDSNVMFYSRHSCRKSFGRIQQIFDHKRRLRSGKLLQQTFLAIKAYSPLSPADAHLDPYSDLEGIGAELVYTAPNPDIVIIPLNDVTCHIAMCPFESVACTPLSCPCSVVVILDEVSPLLSEPLKTGSGDMMMTSMPRAGTQTPPRKCKPSIRSHRSHHFHLGRSRRCRALPSHPSLATAVRAAGISVPTRRTPH